MKWQGTNCSVARTSWYRNMTTQKSRSTCNWISRTPARYYDRDPGWLKGSTIWLCHCHCDASIRRDAFVNVMDLTTIRRRRHHHHHPSASGNDPGLVVGDRQQMPDELWPSHGRHLIGASKCMNGVARPIPLRLTAAWLGSLSSQLRRPRSGMEMCLTIRRCETNLTRPKASHMACSPSTHSCSARLMRK